MSYWGGEQIEWNLQISKHIILKNLYEKGHITKKVFEDYKKNYALLLKEPHFFNRIWKKLFKKENNGKQIILVKQETFNERDEYEDYNIRRRMGCSIFYF